MSALLLTNPFAPLQTSPTSGTPSSSDIAQAANQNETGSESVQPAQESGSENTSGSATSNNGSGAGAGGAASQEPTVRDSRFSRPPDAAPTSVVNAQVAEADRALAEASARRSAIGLVERQRDEALVASLTQAPDVPRLTPAEPPSDMPDPLPTSPFLKRSGGDG